MKPVGKSSANYTATDNGARNSGDAGFVVDGFHEIKEGQKFFSIDSEPAPQGAQALGLGFN